MRVTVDDDTCAGHGNCWAVCPEVFELNDDGFAIVLVERVPAEHEDAARSAVAQCPERAITAT